MPKHAKRVRSPRELTDEPQRVRQRRCEEEASNEAVRVLEVNSVSRRGVRIPRPPQLGLPRADAIETRLGDKRDEGVPLLPNAAGSQRRRTSYNPRVSWTFANKVKLVACKIVYDSLLPVPLRLSGGVWTTVAAIWNANSSAKASANALGKAFHIASYGSASVRRAAEQGKLPDSLLATFLRPSSPDGGGPVGAAGEESGEGSGPPPVTLSPFEERPELVMEVPPDLLDHPLFESFLSNLMAIYGSLGDLSPRRRLPIWKVMRTSVVACREMDKVASGYLALHPPSLWLGNCVFYAALFTLQGTSVPGASGIQRDQATAQLDLAIASLRRKASWLAAEIHRRETKGRLTSRMRHLSRTLRNLCGGQMTNPRLKRALLEITQRIRGLAVKRRRAQRNHKRSLDNGRFGRNERDFYRDLLAPSGGRCERSEYPTPCAVREYWTDVLGKKVPFTQHAPSLLAFEEWCSEHTPSSPSLEVSTSDVVQLLRRTNGSKAPGPDCIPAWFFKKFGKCREAFVEHLNEIFRQKDLPPWMVRGRTILLFKPNVPSTSPAQRPITLLNAGYKVLTGLLLKKFNESIGSRLETVYEQRGGKENISAKHGLLLDTAIVKDARQLRKPLSIAWVDFAKAFDSVGHKALRYILRTLKIPDFLRKMLRNLMAKWVTDFVIPRTGGGETVVPITLRRGIFQGDSLSPLLFTMTLVPLTILLRATPEGYIPGRPFVSGLPKINHQMFVDDIKVYSSTREGLKKLLTLIEEYGRLVGLELGESKCAEVHRTRTGLDKQAEGVRFQVLKKDTTYKYLGMDQVFGLAVTRIRAGITAEVLKRQKALWSSGLTGRNMTRAHNSWVVGCLRYSFGVVPWPKASLEKLQGEMHKCLTMCNAMKRLSNTHRLYRPRKIGGRGLLSLTSIHQKEVARLTGSMLGEYTDFSRICEDVFRGYASPNPSCLFKECQAVTRQLGKFVEFPNGRPGILRIEGAVRSSADVVPTFAALMHQARITERIAFEAMATAKFFREIAQGQGDVPLSFTWLCKQTSYPQTESLCFGLQEGRLPTLAVQSLMARGQSGNDAAQTPLCRLCGTLPETCSHLLSDCPALGFSAYLSRHDAVLKRVYSFLRLKLGLDTIRKKLNELSIIPSIEVVEGVTVFWDHRFQSASAGHDRPDLVLVQDLKKAIHIVEFAVCKESLLSERTAAKRTRYAQLGIALRRQYPGYRCQIVPLVLGTLGGAQRALLRALRSLPGVEDNREAEGLLGELQLAVIGCSISIVKQVITYPRT